MVLSTKTDSLTQPRSPHPLTGGIGDTSPWRDLPCVAIPAVEACDRHAIPLASGFDTIVESFDVEIETAMAERLEEARLRAERLSEDLSGRVLIDLGGYWVQMVALRGRGLKWRLENDDITIRIRPISLDFCVSVRYSAAGLWEHGYPALRRQVEEMVRALGALRRADWDRLSEVHRAFDFFSPDLTQEMRPDLIGQLVAHSEVKRSAVCGRDQRKDEVWGKAGRLETLTIGKGAPLEIQVYDKGREIDEASGKTWMLDLWEASGRWQRDGKGRQSHCWRLEVRCRSDFLRDRSIRTMAAFLVNMEHLLSEALLTRRLCLPTGDSNRARWPLHWFWAAVLHRVGAKEQALPLGRQVTEAPDVLTKRLIKQLAGTLRSTVVLRKGDWDQPGADYLMQMLIDVIEDDPGHHDKVRLAQERYRYAGEAR